MTSGDDVTGSDNLSQKRPLNRLVAWMIDWLIVIAWVGVVAAVGIPLYLAGLTSSLDPLALNVVAVVTLAVPVTVALAAMESSARAATPGKRVRHLRVVSDDTGRPMSFLRALIRNTLKIGIPWTIGHAAAYGLVASANESSMPVPVIGLTITAYAVPLLYVICLFVGAGRTPYDRISRTRVELRPGV